MPKRVRRPTTRSAEPINDDWTPPRTFDERVPVWRAEQAEKRRRAYRELLPELDEYFGNAPSEERIGLLAKQNWTLREDALRVAPSELINSFKKTVEAWKSAGRPPLPSQIFIIPRQANGGPVDDGDVVARDLFNIAGEIEHHLLEVLRNEQLSAWGQPAGLEGKTPKPIHVFGSM